MYPYAGGQQNRRIKMQIIEPEADSCRPLEDKIDLADTIFTADASDDPDTCDFLSGQVEVEKAQIQILLQQIAARHYISRQLRTDLDYRECRLASYAAALEDHTTGEHGMARTRSDLERGIADLHRERSMEAVSVWRDTQKALTELFRHWTSYTNLSRRARVIDIDL